MAFELTDPGTSALNVNVGFELSHLWCHGLCMEPFGLSLNEPNRYWMGGRIRGDKRDGVVGWVLNLLIACLIICLSKVVGH